MSYYNGFKPYVSVAKKKAKALQKIKTLKKKNPNLQPIVIEGSALANSWWGKAWNKNLESYADFANRIGRGRSYVRNNAVLDLQIGAGTINGLVQGSSSTPYNVTVKISALTPKNWQALVRASQGEFESLQQLIAGKFPLALQAIFTNRQSGLFPAPSEIAFDCSCPDWAVMCKHVAATLYGIGARLDQDPSIFFTLRGVDVDSLITQAVEDDISQLLKKAKLKSNRVIDDSDLSSLFGIELDVNCLDEIKPDVRAADKTDTPSRQTVKKKIVAVKPTKVKRAKAVPGKAKPGGATPVVKTAKTTPTKTTKKNTKITPPAKKKTTVPRVRKKQLRQPALIATPIRLSPIEAVGKLVLKAINTLFPPSTV